MFWTPVIGFLALTTLVLAVEYRDKRVHRLIGGHLKIYHEDPHDSELLTALASGSKEKKLKKDDDDKKTLSQQVADGKYGLIQKELFSKPIKRPGLLSYDSNPEVPKDNISNLGGLTKNDIWLAENHLLVLKGGNYPLHDNKTENTANWPAIDDYKAPSRQVKLPAHPKVPPPFPVQLTDNGPLQILGTNYTRTLNGTFDANTYTIPPPPDGYDPGKGAYNPTDNSQHSSNSTSRQTPFPIPTYPSGEYNLGSPFPPFPLNGSLPPFFASLPPGAAILPPPLPENLTDLYDDDDPSIYYPPPYSFYYPKDNNSLVPPGPLVPGIILPPPPNFFGLLDETTTRRSRLKIQTTTTALPQLHPTTTPTVPTVINQKTTKQPIHIFPVHYPAEINNELKPIITTPVPTVVTILPVRQKNRTRTFVQKRPPPSVTVLKPVKNPTQPPKLYVYNNEISANNKPFEVYGPPDRGKTIVSTTQVPLKAYYSTSNEIETNSITQPTPQKFHYNRITQKTTPKPPTRYFYYEEPSKETSTNFVPKDYYVSTKAPQFIYVTGRPYNTPKPTYRLITQQQQTPKTLDTFSVHIARLQKQIQQYYTTPRPIYRQIHSPKPVYQFSFQAANYRPHSYRPTDNDNQDKFRPLPKYSVEIQPAIEIIPTQQPIYQNTPPSVYYTNQQQNYQSSTERPVASKYYNNNNTPDDYEYEDVEPKSTPRPISQYAFEVTQNPIYQGFYTKPDEHYFDDNTKKYFTTFGRKLPSGTTPIPQVIPQRKPLQHQNQNQQQQQKAINLERDTLVNYLPPRRPINSESEYVENQQINYPQVDFQSRPTSQRQNQHHHHHQQQQQQKINNPDIIKAVPVNTDQSGSFISYELPGDDGAHFYFLTPQLAQRRDQSSGYYYSQSNVPRLRRNGRTKEK